MQDNTKFQLIGGPMAMIHEGVKATKEKRDYYYKMESPS